MIARLWKFSIMPLIEGTVKKLLAVFFVLALFSWQAFAQTPAVPIGPGSSVGGGVPYGVTPYVFATKALFQAATSIPANVNYVTVSAVTGTYPPASGQDATPLTYRRVGSSTGLFGEITVAGVIFDPIYSTSPVNAGEFGAVSDGTQTSAASILTSISCPGSSATCSTSAGVINSGTYNPTSGLVTLAVSPQFASGNTITLAVSGATGTGNFASINSASALAQINDVASVAASQTFTESTTLNFLAGDSLTVGNQTFNFVSSIGSTPGNILVGASTNAGFVTTMANISASIIASINSTGATANYVPNTTPSNVLVKTGNAQSSGGTYIFYSGTTGTGGNSFVSTYTPSGTSAGSFGASTLAGGAAAASTVSYSIAAGLTMTITGGNVVASTSGFTSGRFAATPSWHSNSALGKPIIPVATTVVSAILNTSITFNQNLPAGVYGAMAYTYSMSGTDNTNAIQQAINFGLQYKYPTVCIPNGGYLVSNTLQVGWGNGFYQMHLTNCARGSASYYASGGFAGTSLYMTQTNSPGINYQGIYGGKCSGISLLSVAQIWPQYSQNYPNTLSSDALDWLDPQIYNASGPGGIQPHAPLVGISFDAYSGPAPAIPYPNLTYPAFTGRSAQYNADLGSIGDFGGCNVDGFPVSFAAGLNDSSGGDNIKLNGFNFQNGVYGVVIANSQSRTFTWTKSSSAGFHTLITNDLIGSGIGELNGTISDIESGGYYQFAHISMGQAGPTTFKNIYCERCARIGTISGGNGTPSATIENGNFNWGDSGNGVEPTSIMDGNSAVNLVDTVIGNYFRLVPLTTGSGFVTVQGGMGLETESTLPPAGVQTLANYVGGLFGGTSTVNSTYLRNIDVPRPYLGSYWSGGAWGTKYYGNTVNFNSPSAGQQSRVPIDQNAIIYCDTQNQCSNIARPKPSLIALNSTGYAGVPPTVSQDVLTFGYCAVFQNGGDGPPYQIAVGDGLYQLNTNTLFAVLTISASIPDNICTSPAAHYLITAQQQNNLGHNSDNVWTTNNDSDLTFAGNTAIIKASAIAPRVLSYAASVSAACAFSGVSTGDGVTGAATATYYAVGDTFFGFTLGNPNRPWPIPLKGLTLGAVTNGSPASIAAGTAPGGCIPASNVPLFPMPLVAAGGSGGSAAAFVSGGTKPILTTGSCSGSAAVGGATAGSFTAPVCAAGTIILSGLPTAPNGYSCTAYDQTTPADALTQTANSTTSATLKATTVANDVIIFSCLGW